MRYGYARVSTEEQSLAMQLDALAEAGCDEVFQERASGTRDDRPVMGAGRKAVPEGPGQRGRTRGCPSFVQ